MNPDRFARLKELVLTARSLPEEAVRPYLDRACAGDENLLDEAVGLVGFPTRTNFRTAGLDDWLGGVVARASANIGRIPESIGPYRILGLLGRGGMGDVYHAEQTDPFHRSVAVKLVKRLWTSPQAVARFRAEGEALARMDHPDIARIFDAGEDEDGNPYFVMELVRGVPITDFARLKGLPLRECVRLCVRICRAVHHAHQRGIIHRDLKPSNVLVTAEDGTPAPKVIDFGIAKAVGDGRDRGSMTCEGQILGTLEYMSPEQARGNDVGTQADVYSLGVILFELLTGALPHDIRGIPTPEAVRRIAESPPLRLRQVRGDTNHRERDLETILQKCLESDPGARYSSAAALADDLERYLSSLPILAHPQSTGYQLRKMISRHKVPFALTATLFMLLAAFAVTMSVQFAEQRRVRQRAEIETAKAGRINTFLRDMLASVQPQVSGRDVTVVEILDEAARKAGEDLDEEPEVRAELRQTLGEAYMSLERFDDARRLFELALEGLATEIGPRHPKMADLYDDLTSLAFHLGDLPMAEDRARHALEMHRFFDGESSRGIKTSLNNLAFIRLQRGSPAEAESLYRRSLALGRELLGEENREVSITLNNLGHALNAQGRFRDAEEVFRESLALRLRILPAGHSWIASTQNNLATVLLARGAYAEAEAICRETLDAADSKRSAALGFSLLAQILHDTGNLEEAETAARAAVDSMRAAYGSEHPLTAACLHRLGRILETRGDLDSAEATYRDVLARRERLLGPAHYEVGMTTLRLGEVAMIRGQTALADSLLARALDIQERHPAGQRWRRNQALITRAWFLAREGRDADARKVLRPLDPRTLWPSATDRRAGLDRARTLCEEWGWTKEAEAIGNELGRIVIS